MRILKLLQLQVAILSLVGFTIAGDPKVKRTPFENLPTSYFYFEDSPVILSHDSSAQNVWRSEDDGETWQKVTDVPEGKAWDLWEHPFQKSWAYVITDSKKHYKTENKGKTWRSWESDALPSYRQNILAFHAGKERYVLYHGRVCEGGSRSDCEEATFYSKDNFDSDPKLLVKGTHGCMFARSTEVFDKATQYTILCTVDGKDPLDYEKRRLIVSDNWFEGGAKKAIEPLLDGVRPYEGIAGTASVQKFLVVAVRSPGTDEMLLFVSTDSVDWSLAEFPKGHGGLKKDAYTILESTEHSIQVDVLTTKPQNAMGSLFTSNSKGKNFVNNLGNTNRNFEGLVDFEKVKGIQGIILSNQVDNAEVVKVDRQAAKIIKSVISFDDGRTWSPLKDTDKNDIHLHSVTNLHNGGRVFSSPAPGLVMGIGNKGKFLKPYDECDLYVSKDAGVTWSVARKNAHKYEFGDAGSVLVAVNDEEYTDKVAYSLNYGKDWKEIDLGVTVRAKLLTTTPDSTSLKFTLIGTAKNSKESGKHFVLSLDFSDVYDKKCKLDKSGGGGDYEKWYARLDEKGDPDCLMGHKQYFWRRKSDANCKVEELYKDPEAIAEVCPCHREDYECDFNFVRDPDDLDKCVPIEGYTAPPGKCSKPSDTYMGSSGYQLIPGNNCDKDKGDKLDKEVERKCGDVKSAPTNGKITSSIYTLSTRSIVEYYYLEPSGTHKDETIILRTAENKVYLSDNHGKDWKHVLQDISSEVVAIYPHRFSPMIVYFITASKTVWYTEDRGKSFQQFEAPTKPNHLELQIMDFLPEKTDFLIWTGSRDCEDSSNSVACHVITYYSKDGGLHWDTLLPWVRNCLWVPNRSDETNPGHRIYCEKFAKEENVRENSLNLIASDDFFTTQTAPFKDITRFALMDEFILVAAINEDGSSLQLDVSVDGQQFAQARFPNNFKVEHQQGYTVLDSSTHSVFLHVTVSKTKGGEFGTLLKSNSNGTSYVKSIDYVNRNTPGYVDFEKMQGIEGVALINVITNPKEAANGEVKILRSKITHNDGGEWAYIKPPQEDVNGKTYECSSSDPEQCSLNIHGYTERRDPRDTFSSASAIGLMIGIGNVGKKLGKLGDADTFITRDGGINWMEVKKGVHMWEYGDHGSIIVIVNEREAVDTVYYTLDEGRSWEPFKFATKKKKVIDISTIASDTSRQFVLWCKPEGMGEKFEIIQLDFTGLTDKQCKIDPAGKDDDFELWSPSHPSQPDGCLFGHKEQYRRKKYDHLCFIGANLPHPFVADENNCTCTRQDYECDYNYERQNDGTCVLVPGLSKPNHKEECAKDKNLVEWFDPTGYRRIPITTCQGGKEFDKGTSHPCEGKEALWRGKQGGMGAFGIFFLTIVCLGMAGAIGWIIWNRWSGKFGQIRLGDDSRSGENPVLRYGIIAVSAVVAVITTIPVAIAAIYGFIASRFQRRPRYTSRGQFARGDYSSVTNDEGELLGDDSDEEV